MRTGTAAEGHSCSLYLKASSHSRGSGGEQENNFKAVLESIRDLMNEDTVMPAWLHDIFLGYGDPAAARYTNLPDTLDTIDFKDTFLDAAHLRASFPAHAVQFRLAGGSSTHKGEANGSAHTGVDEDMEDEPRPPFRVTFSSAAAPVAPAAKPGKSGKRKVSVRVDLMLGSRKRTHLMLHMRGCARCCAAHEVREASPCVHARRLMRRQQMGRHMSSPQRRPGSLWSPTFRQTLGRTRKTSRLKTLCGSRQCRCASCFCAALSARCCRAGCVLRALDCKRQDQLVLNISPAPI